ncbi:MAG TPA: SIP domain-containing protein [Acidimicrobiales bacterium]
MDVDVDAALADLATEVLPHLNAEYEDSLVFTARILAGRRTARAARMTALDRRGVELVVVDDEGEHRERLEYDAPIDDPSEVTAQLFGLVVRARELSGEDGTTSAERVMAEMAGIRTYLAVVTAVEDVHPHLRRITFSGGDLASFSPVGPDTFLYVLLPPPGRSELTIDRSFSWEQVGAMPEEERPVGAYYTVRAWRPERAELDMLFVLHGDSGPASAWAQRARPGDPVALWGPRSSYHPPARTDWYLLVADETGLPAAANILESLPEGTVARVFAEVDNETERQELPTAPSFAVTWLYRRGAPAGTTTLLPDAVRSMAWPGGTPYVWGGGESRAMTAVRRYVRREIGLPREAVSLVAYWRHASGAGDTDDLDDEDDL